MNLLIFFQLALRNLRLNKFRSILAILGITIGIVAIVTTGMSGAILENSQFQSMNEIGESIYLQVNYTYLWEQQNQKDDYYGTGGGSISIKPATASSSFSYGGGGMCSRRWRVLRISSYVTIYGIENEHLPSMFVLSPGSSPRSRMR